MIQKENDTAAGLMCCPGVGWFRAFLKQRHGLESDTGGLNIDKFIASIMKNHRLH